jgi:hypothetical protein
VTQLNGWRGASDDKKQVDFIAYVSRYETQRKRGRATIEQQRLLGSKANGTKRKMKMKKAPKQPRITSAASSFGLELHKSLL